MLEWHKLIDGNPPSPGRYIVAHSSHAAIVAFHGRFWSEDVSAFTHWAKEPNAPEDGTPQLFTRQGRQERANSEEYRAWTGIFEAGRAAISQEGEDDCGEDA